MLKSKEKKKDRRLRIIWNSNAHWTGSGYAVFTRDLLTRLVKDGWPVAEIGFWGLQGAPTTVDGIKVYPVMNHPYGSDAIVNHSIHYKADVVFTMQDIPTLDPNDLQRLKTWIPYLPIDHDPAPPSVLQRLNFAYKILTFSEFGRKQLEDKGFYSQLILEGTDPDIFKPLDKAEMRKKLGLPQDAFLWGMIAANKENPPRKGFQEALDAFKLFLKDHLEGAILFHTQQVAPTGFPIREYANYLGIANRTFFIDQYNATFMMNSAEVNEELNALDAYLSPSQTEGFGLTPIEAQSCGKLVVVNDVMSMPELIIPGKTGEMCTHEKGRFTVQLGMVYPANVDSLHEKMEKVYQMVKDNPDQVAKDCREHIVKNFNINTQVKEMWIPLLTQLQDELLTKPAEKVK